MLIMTHLTYFFSVETQKEKFSKMLNVDTILFHTMKEDGMKMELGWKALGDEK